MAIGLLVLVFVGFALFGAVAYGISKSNWWPLGLLVCIPVGLLFLSFAGSRQLESADGRAALTTDTGTRPVEVGDSQVAEELSFRIAEHESVAIPATWFVLLSVIVFLVILALLATRLFSSHQRHHGDRSGGRHDQASSFPWGWLIGAIALLSSITIFLTLLSQDAAHERESAKVKQAIAEQERAVSAALAAQESSPQALPPPTIDNLSTRPTAELWAKLTEARIDLDDEKESKAEADDGEKDSTAKEEDASAEDEVKEVVVERPLEAPPSWVTNPPQPVGNVYRIVTTSELYATEAECYDELEQKFYTELQRCMKRILPKEEADLVNSRAVEEMGVPLNFIMEKICKDSHPEVVDTSVGPMKKVHVLMEFNYDIQQELREKWISYRRGLGLATVTKVFTLLLASLGVGFVLLQVDTWTRGYYTKRLLVGLPMAIIALALLLLA